MTIPFCFVANTLSIATLAGQLAEVIINLKTICPRILGPLLFIIFINDFCKLKLFGKIISYADDSVILYSCCNLNDLISQIEADLMEISKWFAVNDLSLNLNKTKYMYFNLRQSEFNLNVKFHSFSCSNTNQNYQCYTLQSVNNIKYLGLYIDSNMKWKTPVNYLVKKLRYVLPS